MAIATGMLREGVGGGDVADRGGPGRVGLERFRLGEVRRRGQNSGDLGSVFGGAGDHGKVAVVQGLGGDGGREKTEEQGETHGKPPMAEVILPGSRLFQSENAGRDVAGRVSDRARSAQALVSPLAQAPTGSGMPPAGIFRAR